MNLFDIIGPVMVGPSSSHTAGACRIGYVARKLLGEEVKQAQILLYGSFLATGKGHGTDSALVAGLMGMLPDDERIPGSQTLASERGMEVTFGEANLRNARPNSVELILTGVSGRHLDVVGESLGGGLINIASVGGLAVNFSGDLPTLIVQNHDRPGRVAEVTGMLSKESINVATLHLLRSGRGGDAVMVIECDQEIKEETLDWLKKLDGVTEITYYSPAGRSDK